ncbi:MAG: methylase [Thermoproteus sp. AZ2]|jgi:release factor glutamine methyltransferase|uniref:Methylase n=1 Tax=Thermoproteus sp. AZ2 TaxID=1609232 RepID=A0ACC6V129_9CREN|nr:MAG: methylase [Thermoproteus sp. AZ2]
MYIYRPAEDSYLTLRVLRRLRDNFGICIDVGAGSCVLSEYLAKICRIVVPVDINVYACSGCKALGPLCAHGLSAIRRADLVVSNPPYLPPEEPQRDWEAVAIYDYGLINHILRWAFAYRPRVLVLTFSSLGRADFVEEALRALGEVLALEKEHYFFEDIISVAIKIFTL